MRINFLVTMLTLLLNLECKAETSCKAKNLYECADGQCVYREYYCDGVQHCRDGSDETVYISREMKNRTGIKCTVFKGELRICHLPKKYTCDGYVDCIRGEDECNCNHTFNCGDGKTCRLRSQFCDSKLDCVLDNLDELKYGPNASGYQCAVTKTQVTNYCMLPNTYVCDGINDCDDGTDECFCDRKQNEHTGDTINNKCFRCLDKTLVIPIRQRCDGYFQCTDLTDECLCSHKFHTYPSLCHQLCKVGDNCGSCKVGQIKCKPGSGGVEICIDRFNVCDRIVHCPLGEDEANCGRESSRLFMCADGMQLVDEYKRCNKYSFDAPRYTTACDGSAYCEDLDDECNEACKNDSLPRFCENVHGNIGFVCQGTKSARIGREICDGYPTCNPAQPQISEDEMGCTNRFYCTDHGASQLPIHIPLAARCNAVTDCSDGSDEVNCSMVTHFYCVTGSPPYISRSKVCNGDFDCANGEDECQNCTKSPFSSDRFLIKSTILRVFVWIIGLIALTGNILVLFHNGVKLRRSKHNESNIVKSSRVLAVNLATADLMIGVYLIVLGVKDVMYQNVYCNHHLEWKSSVFCAVLGCIALVGFETSMFILTIMTTCRLVVIKRPLPDSVCVRKVVWSVAFAWVVSISLAVVPLLPLFNDIFTSAVWYVENPYAGLLSKDDLKDIVLRFWSLQNQTKFNFTEYLNRSTLTWETMILVIAEINSSYLPKRRFGYYSSHGVCLPRIFPNSSFDKSSAFSLFIMLINFSAFAYIMIAYIIIYRIAVVAAKKAGRTDTRTTTGLQKNITRLTMTNFLCWIPVCVVSFISMTGGYIDPTSYAVAAIVLLPINSATDPFLYSEVLERMRDSLPTLKSLRSFRSTTAADSAGERPFELPMSPVLTQETIVKSS